ncbi:MAG: DUF459 domain-containing protein [Alphaproteobacteria bacterium]|nr:DUF459 domain-containing protein [Alphaproteobacteria bacterium]
MKRIVASLILALALDAVVLPPAWAQDETRIVVAQEKKRTLWDLLFGGEAETPKVEAPAASAPSVTTFAPPKPQVDKSETATRLAVLGDSLAVDLTNALERAHAEDPNIVVVNYSAESSGFVRDDYFDWNERIGELIDQNAFDIGVVIIGINDRQPIGENKPLTDGWKSAYSERLKHFLAQMRAAGKPVIWVGLPPMSQSSYSAAMTQISSLHRLAAFSAGAEFVDIYERFVDENGDYSSYGPDLSGQVVQMRKSNGIHFTRAGADKLAFYVDQALKRFYRGGTVSLEVADVLAGTDAEHMMRPPFQGLGQMRLLELAGAVVPLTGAPPKAAELVEASLPAPGLGFDSNLLMMAPEGRADAFGVGVASERPEEEE